MYRKIFRGLSILLAMGLILGLTACKGGSGANEDDTPEYGAVIYYVSINGDELIPVGYNLKNPEADESKAAAELVEAMENITNFSMGAVINYQGDKAGTVPGVQSAFAEGHVVQEVLVESRVAKVFFSNYEYQDTAREILFRAALAYTLTSLEDVDYVYIYVGNQPLMEQDTMNPVGFLDPSEFVYLVGKNVNAYTHEDVVLYFGNADSTSLKGEEVEVTYSSAFSIEQAMVERLIEGPDSSDLTPVMSNTVRVLSVSVKEGTCYVNLDDTFISGALDISPELPVYAIVNSLTERPDINNVQITVNGSSDVTFKETISLSVPLERNLDFSGETGASLD